MRTIKKMFAVGAVTLLLVAGAVTPAQASNGAGSRQQPQSSFWCDWAPWLPGCK
jgi:hypothetical protein